MVTFPHPIAWFLESLRLWQLPETPAPGSEPIDKDDSAGVYDERNTLFWYLPPPC